MTQTKSQLVNLQTMIDTSVSAFLAGERCVPALSFGNYKKHSVDAPTVVLFGWALEVALKLLILISNGKIERGHSINELYEKLSANIQKEISPIEDVIFLNDSPFVNWRYPYEQSVIASPQDIRRAWISVHAKIRQLKPDLVSIYEKNMGIFQPDHNWSWPEIEIPEAEERLKE